MLKTYLHMFGFVLALCSVGSSNVFFSLLFGLISPFSLCLLDLCSMLVIGFVCD